MTDKEAIDKISSVTGIEYSGDQLQVLECRDGMCVVSCAGSGKALLNGTGVLTPNGYVPIETLKVGDICYDNSGKEQEVIGVYPQGEKEIYNVTFSDNSVIPCCKDHLWTYSTDGNSTWTTNNLQYIIDNIIGVASSIEIPMTKPVEFGNENLEANVAAISKLILDGDIDSIPEEYKMASIAERTSLLVTLIGKLAKRTGYVCELDARSTLVIRDIKFIAESLGLTARDINNGDGRYYLIINTNEWFNGLLSDIKLCEIEANSDGSMPFWFNNKPAERKIECITRTGNLGEMTCIKVSGADELFLTENCVVTHNTATLVALIAKRILTNEIKNVKKLLVTTYSVAGREELEDRLNKLLSDVGITKKVEVRTLHSSYLNMLQSYGGGVGQILKAYERTELIRKSVKKAGLRLEEEDIAKIDSLISYQINNMLTDEALFKETAYDLDSVETAKYSEISAHYRNFKTDSGLIDFDDMQTKVFYLMATDKEAREMFRNMWDYFFIDEFQDVSKIQFNILKMMLKDERNLVVIGDDDQCLIEGTKVQTYSGIKNIEDVTVGELVLSGSGRCKSTYMPVTNVSSKYVEEEIVRIETASGKKIAGTLNHIGFAKIPDDIGDKQYIYLMYKHGLGFRVGQTKSLRSGNIGLRNGIKVRLMQEGGDKIWVLKVVNSYEEAVYYENLYSYKYSLPQYIFNDKYVNGALGDTGIKRLHDELGSIGNGYRLLEEFGLDFNYPHHVTQSNGNRVTLSNSMFSSNQVDGFGINKSELSATTSNKTYLNILEKHLPVSVKRNTSYGNISYNARTVSSDVERQKDIIKKVVSDCNDIELQINLNNKAKLTDTTFNFMPFGSFIEGMIVPINVGGEIVEDVVVSITREKYSSNVYDLSVPYTYNFVANDVVVHNCIYKWRGADPTIILNICGYYDITRHILSTNYRCGNVILEHADTCIKNNSSRMEKDMKAFNKGGKITIENCKNSIYHMSAEAVERIVGWLHEGVNPSDISILCRNNIHGIIVDDMLNQIVPTRTSKDMRFGSNQFIRDFMVCLDISKDTTNHLMASHLWKIVKYLKAAQASKISKIMDNHCCSLKVALKSLLTNTFKVYLGDDSGVKNIKEIGRQYQDFTYGFNANAVDELVDLYRILCEEDPIQRYEDVIAKYLGVTINFIHKGEDRIRNILGIADYLIDLAQEKGIDGLDSHIRDSVALAKSDIGKSSDAINLSTMHGSKGKEWKKVIILADDNIAFPNIVSIKQLIEEGHPMPEIADYIEQERRLHYVAMTRAKEDLVVYCNVDKMSVFMAEALGVLEKTDKFNTHIIDIVNDGGYSRGMLRQLQEKAAEYLPDNQRKEIEDKQTMGDYTKEKLVLMQTSLVDYEDAYECGHPDYTEQGLDKLREIVENYEKEYNARVEKVS